MDKFKLSSSSVQEAFLELKAELEAKKQAFQKDKTKGASSEKTVSREKGLFKSSVEPEDLGHPKKERKASARVDEEEVLLMKSREKLEEKARLYEKYKLAALPEELREDVMVDFDKKFVENRHHLQQKEELSDAEREETVDEFGRIVKRPKLQDKVDDLISAAKEKSKADYEHYEVSGPDDLSELNVTEKRSKGVGFYKFSADGDEKAVQLGELNRLRTDTVGSRNKAFIQAEQRRLIKEARLAKIEQQRKKMQEQQDQSD